MRKGAAKGTGKGYRNLRGFPKDPLVHSQSAKGRKQPQRLSYLATTPLNGMTRINMILAKENKICEGLAKINKDAEKGRISSEEEDRLIRAWRIRNNEKRNKLNQQLLDTRIHLNKKIEFNYEEYPRVEYILKGGADKGRIVMMSPQEYLTLVPAFEYYDEDKQYKPSFFSNRVKGVLKNIKKTGKISVGFLDIENNKVVDQEGRHTMIAAMILGVKSVPIAITGDYKSFDKDTAIPEYLGKFRI